MGGKVGGRSPLATHQSRFLGGGVWGSMLGFSFSTSPSYPHGVDNKGWFGKWGGKNVMEGEKGEEERLTRKKKWTHERQETLGSFLFIFFFSEGRADDNPG